jgi:hypothetical protein
MQEATPSMPAEAPPSERSPDRGTTSPSDHGPLGDPRALQILSTEHWSLLATRSLAYNEAFARAGMFLSFLSASLIVIGFLIGAQGLSTAVVPVAFILLLADLFIGAATVGRLVDASAEDLRCIRGMNRIRHAYREMVPGVEPYFVSGFHDDARGVLATYDGGAAPSPLANMLHGMTTTVGMVATIDSMIFGALFALGAIGLGAVTEVAFLTGIVGFGLAFVLFARFAQRSALGGQARAESRFPTPDDAEP